jgi:hypothetical protein
VRGITRITLAACAVGLTLGAGGTAAVAVAAAGGPDTPHATGTVHPATAMSCADLDQTFQSPQTNGMYPVTIVSNQPDGIAGFTGSVYPSTVGGAPGQFSGTQLSGATSDYLFSDRTTFTPPPGGGFGGTYQPFSINAPASLSYTLARTGPGQYTVGLNFGADINRQFSFSAQCIGESLVGYTRAIGNNEWTDDATYTITIGNFVPTVPIH